MYWEAPSMLGRLMRQWLVLFPGCGLFVMSLPIKNKPLVLALCGAVGGKADNAAEDFPRALMGYQVNILDAVHYTSQIPPCYS